MPASRTAIASLPTREYAKAPTVKEASDSDSKASSSKPWEDEHDSCGICLESFSNGEKLKTMPCLHAFHADCLDKWLAVSGTCPVCKAEYK